MIAYSTTPLPIGHIGTGVSDKEGNKHPEQRYCILREATLKEYLQQIEREKMRLVSSREQLERRFFYEVSLD